MAIVLSLPLGRYITAKDYQQDTLTECLVYDTRGETVIGAGEGMGTIILFAAKRDY